MVENLNSGPPNCKSRVLTTRRRCLVDSSTQRRKLHPSGPLPSRRCVILPLKCSYQLFVLFISTSVSLTLYLIVLDCKALGDSSGVYVPVTHSILMIMYKSLHLARYGRCNFCAARTLTVVGFKVSRD